MPSCILLQLFGKQNKTPHPHTPPNQNKKPNYFKSWMGEHENSRWKIWDAVPDSPEMLPCFHCQVLNIVFSQTDLLLTSNLSELPPDWETECLGRLAVCTWCTSAWQCKASATAVFKHRGSNLSDTASVNFNPLYPLNLFRAVCIIEA